MAVIDNQFETKGTSLFFVDTVTTTDPTVTKLTCPTGITGINGGSTDKIDTTCLDVTGRFRTYIPGFASPNDISIPFVLYKGDGSHHALFAMQESGTTLGWMVGLSDATSIPTIDTDGNLVTPVDRTTFAFTGYVSSLNIDMATNEVVRGTLSIQPTGFTTPNWAA